MPRIGSFDYSNRQVGELLTARSSADLHLSPFDRFLDLFRPLFRPQTKRGELERIFTALCRNAGAPGVPEKLVRFNELFELMNEADRPKLTATCGPLEREGGSASWRLQFHLDGKPIAAEVIEGSAGESLHAYHTAGLVSTLRGFSEFLRAHPEPGKLGELPKLLEPLESSIQQCLQPPGLSSRLLRGLLLDLKARIAASKPRSGSLTERLALGAKLQELFRPAHENLGETLEPLARSLLEQGIPVKITAGEVLASGLARALRQVDGADPGRVEETFGEDLKRDHITVAESYRIDGDPHSSGTENMLLAEHSRELQEVRVARDEMNDLYAQLQSATLDPQDLTAAQERLRSLESLEQGQVASLKSHALERLGKLARGSAEQQRTLTAIFTQIAPIAFKHLCDQELAGQPVEERHMLAIDSRDWAAMRRQVWVGSRPQSPWIAEVRFTIEGNVANLQLYDTKGTPRLPLQPLSRMRLEVVAEIERGMLRPVHVTLDADLMPQSGAAPRAPE